MPRQRRLTLGLVGGDACSENEAKLAFETGRQIARAGAVLVCGGGAGVMEAGCSGAKTANGTTMGVMGGDGPETCSPNPHLDFVLYTGFGQGRNQIVVLSSDAVIAIGGEWGTLSEIAIAKKYGIPVVLLSSWSVEGPHGQGLDDLPRAASAKEAVAKAVRLVQGGQTESAAE
jgi:uncharacterized protein (TIGR00725 family)